MRRGRRFLWACVLLSAFLTALLMVSLPSLLEKGIKRALEDGPIELKQFTIEHIGMRMVLLGKGQAAFERGSIGWDEVEMAYSLSSLKGAGLETVAIDGLELEWVWIDGEPAVFDSNEAAGDPLNPVFRSDAEEALPEQTDDAATGSDEREVLRETPFPKMGDWLPFRQFQVSSGQFRLVGDGPRVEIGFSGEVRLEPGRVETDVLVGDNALDLSLSLKYHPGTAEGRWLGAGTIDLGEAFALAMTMEPAFVDSGLITSVEGSPLRFDFLVERTADMASNWSVEAQLGTHRIESRRWGVVLLKEALLMGFGSSQTNRFETGWAVEAIRRGSFATGPFRLDFSVDDQRWALESETIDFEDRGMSGTAAVRGTGHLGSGLSPVGQIELAFASLRFPEVTIAPFSIFGERLDTGWRLDASLLHIEGVGQSTIRESRFFWQDTTRTGVGEANFFGAFGQRLGTLTVETRIDEAKTLLVELAMAEGEASRAVELRARISESGWDAHVQGDLPESWLNEALGWTEWSGWRVEAGLPLEMEMALRSGPLMSGEGRLSMQSLSLQHTSGLQVEEINFDTAFRVQGWPSTVGLQTLTIGSFLMGGLEAEEISVSWSLPTLQQLRVESIEGSLGSGGFRVDPFVVPLAQPAFETLAHLRGIPVQLLFDLVGETRFRVEGTVSGTVFAGWEAGAFLLGTGSFTLDAGGPARFLFQDSDFLERTVASLGGVPEAVRAPLREALLSEGIDVDRLLVKFGPSGDGDLLVVRLELAGNCANEAIQIPIRGIVVEQRLSATDLARLLGLQGMRPIRLITSSLRD
jgi:hypothetical protein